jgi:hypothetical protein
MIADLLVLEVPSGIEPESRASETRALSFGPRDPTLERPAGFEPACARVEAESLWPV